jgi:hypothetical protein
MKAFSGNTAFIRAGLEDLEDYLQSDVLYWSLAGGGGMQRLTLGGLLLGMAVEGARCKLPTDKVELARMENRMETTRSRWQTAWERKCRQEVPARLNQWRQYLEEQQQSPGSEAASYPQEVKRRAILHLLSRQTMVLPEEMMVLEGLDTMVKFRWVPGDFVWESDLATAFPEPEYWFLYGRMRS